MIRCVLAAVAAAVFPCAPAIASTIVRSGAMSEISSGASFYAGEASIDPFTIENGDELDLTLVLDRAVSLHMDMYQRIRLYVALIGGAPGNTGIPSGKADTSFEIINPVGLIKASGGLDPDLGFVSSFGASHLAVYTSAPGDAGLSGVRVHYNITERDGGPLHTVRLLFSVQNYAPIPEPATWAMMLLGFAGAGVVARKQVRRAIAT